MTATAVQRMIGAKVRRPRRAGAELSRAEQSTVEWRRDNSRGPLDHPPRLTCAALAIRRLGVPLFLVLAMPGRLLACGYFYI